MSMASSAGTTETACGSDVHGARLQLTRRTHTSTSSSLRVVLLGACSAEGESGHAVQTTQSVVLSVSLFEGPAPFVTGSTFRHTRTCSTLPPRKIHLPLMLSIIYVPTHLHHVRVPFSKLIKQCDSRVLEGDRLGE